MDLTRLAIAVSCLGLLALITGVSVWASNMPTDYLRNGYMHCLWSSSYSVEGGSGNRYFIGASGQVVWLVNPKWDPNNSSCETVEQDHQAYGQAQRQIERLRTGIDPGPKKAPPTLLVFTPPFLNGTGVILLLIGGIILVARPRVVGKAS